MATIQIDLIPGCVVSALTMKSMDEQILRATKEIVVKFIELGRLSPSNVHESIRDIHATIRETVKESMDRESTDQE